MKHTIQDCFNKTKEVEIHTSPLGITIGPFFIFYEDEKLCCSVNNHVNIWAGDLVDPLTSNLHTLEQEHPDDVFTITERTS